MEDLSKFASPEDAASVICKAVVALSSQQWPQLQELCSGLAPNNEQTASCKKLSAGARAGEHACLLSSKPRTLADLAVFSYITIMKTSASSFSLAQEKGIGKVRLAVDRLLASTFNSLEKLGYKMGRQRRRRATEEGENAGASYRKRGRANMRDDPEVIARVQAALEANWEDSSRLCYDRKEQAWVTVRTLTADRTASGTARTAKS